MPQLVFLHGPGAGACADAYVEQLGYFPNSIAPTFPGHLEGRPCANVARYSEWLRGWLWGQGFKNDLVLVGYTLGACIALQYGLDYPDEVKGIVAATVAARPKGRKPDVFELRRRAAENEKDYKEWFEFQQHAMYLVDPALREKLLDRHRQVGPLSQYHDMMAIAAFDVRDRISTLKPKLLLLRGLLDHDNPPEFELEIAEAVPGSQYIKLPSAGHFPFTESPRETNRLIEEFVSGL